MAESLVQHLVGALTQTLRVGAGGEGYTRIDAAVFR